MVQRRAAAIVVIGAASVAACGSSGGSVASWKAKVDAVCAASNRQVEALPAITSLADLERDVNVYSTAATRITAITVPDAVKGQAGPWLADINRTVSLAKTMIADLHRGQTSLVTGLLAQNKGLTAAANAKAAALGLPDCAKDVHPGGGGSATSTSTGTGASSTPTATGTTPTGTSVSSTGTSTSATGTSTGSATSTTGK